MRGFRSRRGALGESRYRERRTGTARYLTSRQQHDGLDAVVRRYPSSDTTGATFVLVHGIGVSSKYFQPAAAELARTGEVYLVDLPGYGSAPNPKRPVAIRDHARVLAEVIHEAGLMNPVLVGHSMGSQVVSQLAVDSPELSDCIVLMAPTMYPDYRSIGIAARKLLRDIWREPWRVKVIVGTDYLFRCGLPYFLKQVPFLLEDRIEQRVPDIRARVLVMRGDEDVIVPRDWAKAVAALAELGSFTEVRGPHVVMFTDPVSVAQEIAAHARGSVHRPAS
ncbi:MAG: alpha/beta hydrolase [Terrimesophilobacter sp.]